MNPGVGGDISSSRLELMSDEAQPSQESPIVLVSHGTPMFMDWQYHSQVNVFHLGFSTKLLRDKSGRDWPRIDLVVGSSC